MPAALIPTNIVGQLRLRLDQLLELDQTLRHQLIVVLFVHHFHNNKKNNTKQHEVGVEGAAEEAAIVAREIKARLCDANSRLQLIQVCEVSDADDDAAAAPSQKKK